MLSYAHTIVCQHTTEFLSLSVMLKKKNNTSLHTSASPSKWNTYIRHHCGLHKYLKVINISSSVRLMCLVIGYLCCGLPLSNSPLHFGICAHACTYSTSLAALYRCVFVFMYNACVRLHANMHQLAYICCCCCVWACACVLFPPFVFRVFLERRLT